MNHRVTKTVVHEHFPCLKLLLINPFLVLIEQLYHFPFVIQVMFVCNCFNSVEGKNITVVQYTLDQSYLFSNGLYNMMIVSNTNFHTLTEK